MPTKPKTIIAEDAHDLRCRLSAGTVEAAGVIRGATVAKANVVALGKFLMLDKAGAVTGDPKQMAKKLPIFTDAKMLTTLMGAVQDAGGKLKVREDHDDLIGARAGFADNFALAKNGTVTADIHLFDSYRNRSVVLETASKTPDKIGLSIDFVPTYEIAGDKAFMRVESIEAVDIVDAGAITPDGMFLSRGVDTVAKVKLSAATQPETNMTPEEIMAEMNKIMAPYLKGLDECKAAIAQLAKPATPDTSAMKAEIDSLKLKAEAAEKEAKAATAATAQLKKEKALLGLRGSAAVGSRETLAGKTAEEIEKLNAESKDYLTLVEERVASEKCKKSDAHIWVQRNHRELYAEHLKAKGVYDPNRSMAKVA